MSYLKKRKVTFKEGIKTKRQKVGVTSIGKIQKYSSSSDSESDDPIPKQGMKKKTLKIQRKIKNRRSSDSSTSLKEKNLSEGKENSKKNGGKDSTDSDSSDSNKHPSMIDKNGHNGLQKYVKNEVKMKKPSPVKAKSHSNTPSDSESEIEGTQEIVKKINYTNFIKSKKITRNTLHVTTSESESDSDEVENTSKTKSFGKSTSTKIKEVNKTSKATTSESESDVEASQETTRNHRNVITTRAMINEIPNVGSSESESDSDSNKKSTRPKINNSKDENEEEKISTSASESDAKEAEKLASTKNHVKGTNKKNNSKVESEIFSKSESDSDETKETKSTENLSRCQKKPENVESNERGSKETKRKMEESTVGENEETDLDTAKNKKTKLDTTEDEKKNFDTAENEKTNQVKLIKSKKVARNTLDVTTSGSKSDSDEVEKTSKTKSFNKSTFTKIKEVNKTSKATTSESESDVEASQETTRNHRNVITTRAMINKRPNVGSSESESDSGSKKKLTQPKINNSKDENEDGKKECSKQSSNNSTSTSESGAKEAEKLTSTQNHVKSTNKTDSCKIESEIVSKSESDPDETQETESTENLRTRHKKPEDVESNERGTKETERKSDEEESMVGENEETNFDTAENEKTNLDTTETVFLKVEIPEDLKTLHDMPNLGYNLQMPIETGDKSNSEESDFELTMDNGNSHGEKEPTSSDTGQSNISNDTMRKTNTLAKKKRNSPKKVSTSVAEVEREIDDLAPEDRQDQVSSDDSAEEEDLNEACVSFTQSSYEPTKEERLKLANMVIEVGYKVLRQHEVESTAGTRTMNDREREDFETITGFPIKRGKFDSSEDKILKKNWKLFCETHGWDPKNPKPFLFMKHNNKEFLLSQVNRKRFMQRLARGLPNRSLYSIFQRFKNLFEPHRTCRYTEDEDRVVVDFISKYNDVDQKDCRFAKLATILKRTRASVWRRYRVLKKKQMFDDNSFCHSNR